MHKQQGLGIFNRKVNFRRVLKTVIAIVLATCFMVIILASILWYQNLPRDLGPKLTFVGKNNYGCAPFPLSFICLSPRGTTYYFATDMGFDELKVYFKGLHYKKSPNIADGENEEYMYFYAAASDQEAISVTYSTDAKPLIKNFDLRDVGKLHIISTNDYNYPKLLQSLSSQF